MKSIYVVSYYLQDEHGTYQYKVTTYNTLKSACVAMMDLENAGALIDGMKRNHVAD